MKWLGGGRYLQEGAEAPDFELPDQQGEMVKLYENLENQWVVLFFYPKDDSPVCTKQVCEFRNSQAAFQALNSKVFGISGDSTGSHGVFAEHHHLPYPILSDTNGSVQRAYSVSKLLGLISERVTFVIGPDRRIHFVYSDLMSATSHVEKVLSFLKTK